MKKTANEIEMAVVVIVYGLIFSMVLAAWFTHVLYCIKNEQWLFLIAGAIAAPIAVIHGMGIWFGLF